MKKPKKSIPISCYFSALFPHGYLAMWVTNDCTHVAKPGPYTDCLALIRQLYFVDLYIT